MLTIMILLAVPLTFVAKMMMLECLLHLERHVIIPTILVQNNYLKLTFFRK